MPATGFWERYRRRPGRAGAVAEINSSAGFKTRIRRVRRDEVAVFMERQVTGTSDVWRAMQRCGIDDCVALVTAFAGPVELLAQLERTRCWENA